MVNRTVYYSRQLRIIRAFLNNFNEGLSQPVLTRICRLTELSAKWKQRPLEDVQPPKVMDSYLWDVGPNQPYIHWPKGVKRPKPDPDYLPPSSVQVQNRSMFILATPPVSEKVLRHTLTVFMPVFYTEVLKTYIISVKHTYLFFVNYTYSDMFRL
jgi:hypothetical protein